MICQWAVGLARCRPSSKLPTLWMISTLGFGSLVFFQVFPFAVQLVSAKPPPILSHHFWHNFANCFKCQLAAVLFTGPQCETPPGLLYMGNMAGNFLLQWGVKIRSRWVTAGYPCQMDHCIISSFYKEKGASVQRDLGIALWLRDGAVNRRIFSFTVICAMSSPISLK